MNQHSTIARVGRHHGTLVGSSITIAAAIMLLGMLPHPAHAAETGTAVAASSKSKAVTLEKVDGSTIPRITLSAKAAERLGIQTGTVGEELVLRTQMVSGLVIPVGDKAPAGPSGGGFGAFGMMRTTVPVPPDTKAGALKRVVASPSGMPQTEMPAAESKPVPGDVWVLVTLSPGEYERLAKDKPARLVPLATRTKFATDLLAVPTGQQPQEDMKRTMLSLYYKVAGKDHGLAINHRMRVELQLEGAQDKQKSVPYSSIYYDAKGDAWVYANPAALTYERRQVVVDRVVGDTALLAEGPAVGTSVVTIGAALLYGTEVFKK